MMPIFPGRVQALTHFSAGAGEQYLSWSQSSWMRHSSGKRSGVSTSTWSSSTRDLVRGTRGTSWAGLTPSWSLRPLSSMARGWSLVLAGVPPTGITTEDGEESWPAEWDFYYWQMLWLLCDQLRFSCRAWCQCLNAHQEILDTHSVASMISIVKHPLVESWPSRRDTKI